MIIITIIIIIMMIIVIIIMIAEPNSHWKALENRNSQVHEGEGKSTNGNWFRRLTFFPGPRWNYLSLLFIDISSRGGDKDRHGFIISLGR